MIINTDRNDNIRKLLLRQGMSVGLIYRLLRRGKITVNNKIIKSLIPLVIGDTINIDYSFIKRRLPRQKTLIDINPEIIYENNDILVINKEAGIASQGGRYLENRNYADWAKQKGLFPLHRLDFYSSGLLLFAKNYEYTVKMGKKFADKKIHKYYVAKTSKPIKYSCEISIYYYHENRELILGSGSLSKSYIIPLDSSTVLVKPITGRKHQVRIHLALLGSPLSMDKLYGRLKFNSIDYEDCIRRYDSFDKINNIYNNNPQINKIDQAMELANKLQGELIDSSYKIKGKLPIEEKIDSHFYLVHYCCLW